jgi:hypothetical protein
VYGPVEVFLIVAWPACFISHVIDASFAPELRVATITGKLPPGKVAVNGNFTSFFWMFALPAP